MAATQPLIAAFAFGIILVVACAGAAFCIKSHGVPILQDSLRLALVVFLTSSALWAVVDFVGMHTNGVSSCQVAVSLASIFDQLARAAILQALLWRLAGGVKLTLSTFVPQSIICLRFVAGWVYVGFQRTDFEPTCLSSNSLLPLSISVLAVDELITIILLGMFLGRGKFGNAVGEPARSRSSFVALPIAGVGLWTALSGPMILGIETLGVFLRATLSAIGLLILIAVVILCKTHLVIDDPSSKLAPVVSAPREHRISGFAEVRESGRTSHIPVSERPPSQYADIKRNDMVSRFSTSHAANRSKELPNIHHPMPGQSATGMGGVPIAGQLFPPPRLQMSTDGSSLRDAKKPPRGLRGGPKKDFAKPIISGPVLLQNNPTSLTRIPTISLEDAARSEKQRREMMQTRQTDQGPSSHTASQEQMVQRSRSATSRKAIGGSPASPVVRRTLEPILETASSAATSGAQLSPAIEDMRRRSPRNPSQTFTSNLRTSQSSPKIQSPVNKLAITRDRDSLPDAWELLAVPSNRNSASEPRSSLPTSPQDSTPASLGNISISKMFPIPHRQSSGRHRRSDSISSRLEESDVMFTDSKAPPPIPKKCFEEKDSEASKDASPKQPHRPESPPSKFQGTDATIPERSSPRNDNAAGSKTSPKPETKFSLFPTDKNIGASSVKPRVGALKGLPGMPSIIESKTVHGQGFGNTDRTVFMIKDLEYGVPYKKINSAPADKPLPQCPALDAAIRNSVLSRPRPIPRTPESAFLLQSHIPPPRPKGHRVSMSVDSSKSKKSVLRSLVPGSPTNLPPLPPVPSDVSWRPRPNATKSMTFEEKMEIFYQESMSSRRSSSNFTRRRSMSLPEIYGVPREGSDSLAMVDLEDDDDNRSERSTMSSVKTHSILNLDDRSVKARNSQASSKSRAKSILNASRNNSQSPIIEDHNDNTDAVHFSGPKQDSREEPVKDAPEEVSSSSNAVHNHSPQEMADGEREELATTPPADSPNGWNSRVGKQFPTFSSRRGVLGSKRGPPPTPLLLNQPRATIVVQSEPSPLESPNEALGMIEEQLRKLERSSQVSAVDEKQRMTLLADLEMEMGLQEDRWHNIRHTVARDSLSTVEPSPHVRQGYGDPRRSRVLDDGSSRLLVDRLVVGDYSLSPLAIRRDLHVSDDESSRNSVSHKSISGNRISHLTVSHATTSYVGSPTPPDTDESELQEAIATMYPEMLNIPSQDAAPSLWRHDIPSPRVIKHEPCLWSPSGETSLIGPERTSPPAHKRPSKRTPLEPAPLQSSRLWRPPKIPRVTTSKKLWGSSSAPAPVAPLNIKPAPLARKPIRKSKRMTTLPDILENPEPLPEKRDTLGIFQFPWGEKSDTGALPGPAIGFGAMPGTMTSGASMIMNPLFAFNQRFPVQGDSSFLENYEDEDDGDNFSDFDSDTEDDDFDDSTIWEIASLLKTDKPSGPATEQDDDGSEPSSCTSSPTSSSGSPDFSDLPVVLDLDESTSAKIDQFPLPKAKQPLPPPPLWKAKSKFFRTQKSSKGLSQPDVKTWSKYLSMGPSSLRKTKRSITPPATVESTRLWTAPHKSDTRRESRLWEPTKNTKTAKHTETAQAPDISPRLWSLTNSNPPPRPTGWLWAGPQTRSVTQTPSLPSAGPEARRKVRKQPMDMPVLQSTNLWAPQQTSPSRPSPKKTASKIPRRQTVRPAASKEDWESALAEATKASSSHKQVSARLWSAPPSDPSPSSTSTMWTPSSSKTQPSSLPRPIRYPRKVQHTSSTDDFTHQTMWDVSRARSTTGQQTNWLNKTARVRTFNGDVEMVQRFLSRRWEGLS